MQTTINAEGQPAYIAGQSADNGPHDEVSGFSEETVLEIPFGCGVVQGVASQGVKLPAASTDKPEGINVFSFDHMPAGVNDAAGNPTGDLGSTGLKPKALVTKGRKGRYVVPIDSGIVIAPGDRPFLRFRTDGGVNVQPGTFSNAQDGGTNLIDCTRLGEFRSAVFAAPTATGGSVNVAILEVDFSSRNS